MKILNKLTIKHLLMNRKRTIVTIIGVILSTSLMVGIGLIVSSFRESFIEEAKYYNGSQHVILSNISVDKSDIIENNYKIKEYGKLEYIDDYYIDVDFRFELYNIDKKYLEKFDYIGNLPTSINEVIVPKTINKEINDEIEINSKKYKIVGKYGDTSKALLPQPFSGYIYTSDENVLKTTYLITFKNTKNAYDYINELVNELNIDDEDVMVNSQLLAFYGSVKYSNIMDTMTKIILIVLSLVSIACIIVIYNSFAISVMERKKQFGLFSSIGTTKSQLIKTVYFEAIIISLIGIPLGILASYLGIGIVIKITNSLLSLGENVLNLSTYPLFIIIPIIFMIITILVSAFIPALKASRVSPIEAIRMNDDIKIKSKKVKTPKFIIKIFGIEGDLALKNIKRNKKKYRVTIISLFISIVLFITFSSFINYVFGGIKYLSTTPSVDVAFQGYITEEDKKIIVNNKNVDDYLEVYHIIADIRYNDLDIDILVIDDNSFNKVLNKIGKKERKPIIPNIYKTVEYDTSKNKRVIKIKNKFDKVENIKICIEDKCNIEFNDYYLVDETTELLDSFIEERIYIVLTSDMLKDYENYTKNYMLLFKTKNDIELTNFIKEQLKIDENRLETNNSIVNYAEEFRLEKNIIIVIKIFVYGFIALVTLIGVTSVINTINTSIALRRKEFAILRSIGLNKKGFNKMIYFESLFFGLKSLMYALPVSIVIIYLIHKSMVQVVEFETIMLPIMQMVYAIIGVFIIVLLTMLYASHRIKKDNILEAIREENI